MARGLIRRHLFRMSRLSRIENLFQRSVIGAQLLHRPLRRIAGETSLCENRLRGI